MNSNFKINDIVRLKRNTTFKTAVDMLFNASKIKYNKEYIISYLKGFFKIIDIRPDRYCKIKSVDDTDIELKNNKTFSQYFIIGDNNFINSNNLLGWKIYLKGDLK